MQFGDMVVPLLIQLPTNFGVDLISVSLFSNLIPSVHFQFNVSDYLTTIRNVRQFLPA